jgi:peroxiredoxin
MICQIELGKLEQRHAEFDERNTRIIAASLEGPADSQQSQAKFPHLTFIADEGRGLATAANVIGPHHGPEGQETTAPTTILIDRQRIVREVYRPDRYIRRRTPDEELEVIDECRLRSELQ